MLQEKRVLIFEIWLASVPPGDPHRPSTDIIGLRGSEAEKGDERSTNGKSKAFK